MRTSSSYFYKLQSATPRMTGKTLPSVRECIALAARAPPHCSRQTKHPALSGVLCLQKAPATQGRITTCGLITIAPGCAAG